MAFRSAARGAGDLDAVFLLLFVACIGFHIGWLRLAAALDSPLVNLATAGLLCWTESVEFHD